MMREALGWGLVAASGWAALSFLAHRGIYYPMRHPQGLWEGQAALGVEDVWLTTADGVKLHAWWAPAPDAKVATLFLHGNAGNVSHRAYAIRAIREAGSSVLVPDYRGYGKSEGSPSEQGLYRDADAAYAWLLARQSDAKIIIHGESLGSSVAVDLAARTQPVAVILEAPFPSARAVAGTVLPVLGPSLVWGFDARSKIRKVHAPLWIFHGDRDEIIDLSLGRDLFEAANEPKQFWQIPGAGHNNISDRREYGERLAAIYAGITSR
jgi:fermentation-respiration switch protein FrsA (DUF1100 family)